MSLYHGFDPHEYDEKEEIDRLTASVERDMRIIKGMFLALAGCGLCLIAAGLAGWL